ncbi:MAG: hypothetical protein IPK17_21655 [Chloroflexi bacterium]|uniref:hypothetical protein n=1 Tax=Candidatus Flexifilum breve TaxID=3140694 RepID=UPI003134CB1B|nr:hypothetical protein [Chloroflexota bacterium]
MSGVPDRRKAALMGVIGGVLGAYAMRYYTRRVVPVVFPRALLPAEDSGRPDPLEDRARAPAVRRRRNTVSGGGTPRLPVADRKRAALAGNARPARRPHRMGVSDHSGVPLRRRAHDDALARYRGGFFMGLRMWGADEIGAPLLGLRAGSTRFRLANSTSCC